MAGIMSSETDTEISGIQEYAVGSRDKSNAISSKNDLVAEEKAIAMVYNGISHAVMMASPIDLEDFAVGFSLTEGIVDKPVDIRDIQIVESSLGNPNQNIKGYEIKIDIASSSFMQLKQRRRQLSGRTGCGICGIESLEAVIPAVKPVSPQPMPEFQSIEKALHQMRSLQALHSQCGAVHAATYVSYDGDILELREDVGRHNALDKILGAIAIGKPGNPGFILVSSRASFEMVAKTASQSISTLVAISAPTDFAIELAVKANMNLVGFSRPGRQLIYNQCHHE